jgi:hypothetical protein
MLTFVTLVVAWPLMLIAVKCASVLLRMRGGSQRAYGDEPQETLSMSQLFPRVRRNFVAVAHSRVRPASYRSGLLASTRRIVTRFSYFQDKHDHETETHPW